MVNRIIMVRISFIAHLPQAVQTAAVRELIRASAASLAAQAGPLVLVTHQVNITALTNVMPRSGELIIVQPLTGGRIQVLGRLEPGNESDRATPPDAK